MLIRSLLIAAMVLATAPVFAADVAPKWEAGKSYALIDPPQPTTTGNKIEVLEVFSYACPHCAEFQPFAEKLKATLPKNAAFTLLPATFQPRWELFARAFYVAKGQGLIDKTHQAMFDAVWRDHTAMDSLDDIASFYALHGADKATFLSTAQSFVIDGDMQAGRQREVAYGIDSTPTLVVNGKYRISANAAEHVGFAEMVEIAEYLVAEEAKQKR